MGSKDAPFPDLQNEYMVWYVPMNYMEVMTKIRKLKKKKKKKKKGGGVVWGRSVSDFHCLCPFKFNFGGCY